MDVLGDFFAFLHSSFRPTVEAATAYASSLVLFLQGVNYAVLGGLILFLARAAVDIPKAVDYWRDRQKKKYETKGD